MKILVALAALLLAAPASADLWVEHCTVSAVNCTGVGAPYDCCTAANAGATCPLQTLSGQVGGTNISWNKRACWTFDSTDLVTVDSPTFNVTSGSALICYDHDIATGVDPVAATEAEMMVRRCPDGGRPGTNPANNCIGLGGANGNALLTGLEGDEQSQNNCLRVGVGFYYLDITTRTCAAGQVCRVSIEGETAAN